MKEELKEAFRSACVIAGVCLSTIVMVGIASLVVPEKPRPETKPKPAIRSILKAEDYIDAPVRDI